MGMLHAELAPNGLKDPALLLDVFYAFMSVVKKSGKDGVDDELYSSLADVDLLEWDWGQQSGPADTATDFADTLTEVPAHDLLELGLIKERKPDLIRRLLKLISPE